MPLITYFDVAVFCVKCFCGSFVVEFSIAMTFRLLPNFILWAINHQNVRVNSALVGLVTCKAFCVTDWALYAHCGTFTDVYCLVCVIVINHLGHESKNRLRVFLGWISCKATRLEFICFYVCNGIFVFLVHFCLCGVWCIFSVPDSLIVSE